MPPFMATSWSRGRPAKLSHGPRSGAATAEGSFEAGRGGSPLAVPYTCDVRSKRVSLGGALPSSWYRLTCEV